MSKADTLVADDEETLKQLQREHSAALTAGDLDRINEIQAELDDLLAQRDTAGVAHRMILQYDGRAVSVARLRAKAASEMGYAVASRRWIDIADAIDRIEAC